MILADKIIALRKKNGWSQEELADKLNVSRQSVSKWEGAQSTPDLNKILAMAELFGVSTDYLLKDELEAVEYTQANEDASSAVRRVTMEEANEFLEIKERSARKIALATFLCIISPICLMLLAAAAETDALPISEGFATGAGLIIMILLVASAVALFISVGGATEQYRFLDTEPIETEYGVSGMVKERQKRYREVYNRCNIVGVCACILSVLPIFCAIAVTEDAMWVMASVCLMLLIVGAGVVCLLIGGISWASMQKLLQEGDYTRQNKRGGSIYAKIGKIYWPIIVALYLGYSFITNDWQRSWIIWPVAGVLFAAISGICSSVEPPRGGGEPPRA